MKNLIEISGGGFHNMPSIKFKAETVQIDGQRFAVLNERQYQRLKKHFCGMADCTCYSWPHPHPDSPTSDSGAVDPRYFIPC